MADPAYIVDGVLTAGEAWVAIGSTTVAGSSAADITFTSTDDGQVGDFSQYMDLVIISYVRSTYASTVSDFYMQYSGDTGSNYARQDLIGNGSAASASALSSRTNSEIGWGPANSTGANIFSSSVTHIFDINSGKYKSDLSLFAADEDGGGTVQMWANTWKSQAPITSVRLDTHGDFAIGTRIDLFGVLPRMVA